MNSDAARIARRLLENLNSLVAELGATYREEVPEYGSLTDEQMSSEILPVSQAVVETFLRAVSTGRSPKVEGVKALETMGSRRIEMGVPLEPMLHVFRVAGRRFWDALVEAAEPSELGALTELAGAWMDYIDRASSIAASSYLDASRAEIERTSVKRDALFQGLLTAKNRAEVAALSASLDIELASAYSPAIVSGCEAELVAAAAPRGSVVGFRSSRVIVLSTGSEVGWLADLEPELVVYGRRCALGEQLSVEFQHIEVLARIAADRGITGFVSAGDLIVDQLLELSPHLREIAASAFGRLVDADVDGVLRQTLNAWLEVGVMTEAARLCHVHANTVAYRLGRIRDITGLDPKIPADSSQLMIGATAHQRLSTAP